MGYNAHDLNKGVNRVKDALDDRAKRRGEDAADRLLSSTSSGGGLWFLIKLPVSVVISMFAMSSIGKLGAGLPDSTAVGALWLVGFTAVITGVWMKKGLAFGFVLLGALFALNMILG